MSKTLIFIALVILGLMGSFFLFKQYVGDIRPAVFPAEPKRTNNTSQGTQNGGSRKLNFQTEEVPFDLKVSGNFIVALYADEIGKVRDLTFSPEGILLASVPSEGRVIGLVPDSNGVTHKKVIIDELRGPHGIAFYEGTLFIAEEHRVSRFSWNSENMTAVFEKELFGLPGGGHDAHTIIFDKSGNLFVKSGSECNVCIETDPKRATVIKSDKDGNNPQVFATGLRNAAFLTMHPETGELWGTENGRDRIGDDIPEEEINIIREGKNYGWPNCYGNKVIDTTFYKGGNSQICADTEIPAVLMQAHSAPLGLSFIPENFSEELKGDLLVAFHGSWNRSEPTGYKLVRINIDNGQIKETTDFLTGFIDGSSAVGRPVDVEFDREGNLFVSDDKLGAIYVISKK